MSSAICIFHGWVALISSLIHWIRDHALGSSPRAPLRITDVPSQRSPSTRDSVSHESTLSRMN